MTTNILAIVTSRVGQSLYRSLSAIMTLLLVLSISGVLRAQDPPPHVLTTITYTGPALVQNDSFTVTVHFCLPWQPGDGGSGSLHDRLMKLDGVDVTASFSGGGEDQNDYCDVIETWTATLLVDISTKSHTFYAEAWNGGYISNTSTYFSTPDRIRGVHVASPAAFITPIPGSTITQVFTVKNTGIIPTTYSLTVSCASNHSMSCSLASSSATGTTPFDTVSVTITAPTSQFDTGTVVVKAVDDYLGSIKGIATTNFTTKNAPGSGTVLARDLANVSRAHCVTASAGADAAMECGDLRIVHPLPGVVTMGKARVPTLIYNSQEARPMPVILADITLPSGSLPDSVRTYVEIGTPPWYTADDRGITPFPGSMWGAGGNTRRVSAPVNAAPYSTSLQDYFYCVWPSGASWCTAWPVGSIAIVNRSASNFGGGWWLAGLEQLVSYSADSILWIGGDGSTKLYSRTNSTTFKALAFDRPDSITVSSGTYTRWGPQKLQVQFNSSGLHTLTINRLNDTTAFAYNSGTTQLSTISVPVRSGSPLVYHFYYDGNSVLDSVVAPGTRTVALGRSGHQITSITDPDGSVVHFTYASGDDAYRINSRIGRLNDTTTFTYNSVNQLTQSSLSLGSGNYITHNYRPAESAYIGTLTYSGGDLYSNGTAFPVDSGYTSISGAGFNGSIWTNQYGAPTRVRDAMGGETQLIYGSGLPGLIAQSRSPLLQRTTYNYNTDGNLTGKTDYLPVGTPYNAATTYSYDGTWKTLTAMHHPQGETDTLTYDGSYGNVLTESSGGVDVSFAYETTRHQLDSTVTAGSYVTHFKYNTLGNDSVVVSPKGYATYHLQNAIGQDTLVAIPFSDTTNVTTLSTGNYTRVRKLYSRAGRDSLTVTLGPTVGSTPADTLAVRNEFDADGHVTATWRKFKRHGTIDSLGTTTQFDKAGRMVSNTAPNRGHTNYFVYDALGNLGATLSGTDTMAIMKYDAANRLQYKFTAGVTYGTTDCYTAMDPYWPWYDYCSWQLPTKVTGSSFCIDPDTARFDYDAGGNMVRADNKYAHVRRTYTQNGLVATDTLSIRSVTEPGNTACAHADSTSLAGGDEFTRHIYGLSYAYDLDNRRTSMHLPTQFPCSTTCLDYYSYDGYGRLDGLSDELSGAHTFSYDGAGRLNSIALYNGVTDASTFDAEGRLATRSITGGYITTPLLDSLAYDASGRIAHRRDAALGTNVDMIYGPLGAVISSGGVPNATGGFTTETRAVDGLGNTDSTVTPNVRGSSDIDKDGRRTSTMGSGGQITNITSSANGSGFAFNQTIGYDARGNVSLETTQHLTTGGNLYEATGHYYNGDNQLRLFNRATGPYGIDNAQPGHRAVYEEYRYDALGRRVFVHSERTYCTITGNSECASYVERTVYDGDQVVMEIRSPGAAGDSLSALEDDAPVGQAAAAYPFGVVGYVHAGGIDQPLTVLRNGLQGVTGPYVIFPHLDWRGQYAFGTHLDGTICDAGCAIDIAWPGGKTSIDGAVTTPHDGPAWFGSLIPGGSDGSGMHYKRSRYYDPSTGQFTQEDPAGLAGGMNTYGFAGGDPVNFSDPMGLWPQWIHSAFIAAALGRLPNSDLDQIKAGSAYADRGGTQGAELSYIHSMLAPGETEAQMFHDRSAYYAERMATAKARLKAGDRPGALFAFGEAIHPLMDATSPYHTDPATGHPLTWNPHDKASEARHIAGESTTVPTGAQKEQNRQLIQKAYSELMSSP